MLSVFAHALKSWRNAKPIALLATLALAIGIGATTAIYTVVNTVLFGLLPFPDADRFVAIFSAHVSQPDRRGSLALADLPEFQRRTGSFDLFGWFQLADANLSAPGEPQHVNVTWVTSSLIENLGVNPIVGRWFTDETGAVISNALWRRLGSDPGLIGQGMTLGQRRLTITGVMEPGFRLPVGGFGTEGFLTDVWVYLDPRGRRAQPPPGGDQDGDAAAMSDFAYFAYARRRSGVTLAQAEADVKSAAAEIAKLDPATHPGYTARVDDLREMTVVAVRPILLLLFGAAGLLLSIACANVAGLLLARSVARARETATRVALGASRGQLALHYFAEALLVSLAGAVAGVILSIGLVRVVVSIASGYIPRAAEIVVDWKVLLYALASAVVASGVSSMAPLWQAFRTTPLEVFSAGVRVSAGAPVRRLSRALVVAEIALAFTLLAVGAVLIAHLRNLTGTPPGFDTSNLLTFSLTIPESRSSNATARVSFQKRLTEALAAMPGVTDAGFGSGLPVDGCCFGGTIYPEGRAVDSRSGERTSFVFVNPEYFRTLRIPLRRGRLLTEADTSEAMVFMVLNEAAASRYWPNEDPVDAYGRLNAPDGSRFQVVGVVGDVRNDGLGSPVVPEFYMLNSILPINPMSFIVRSELPTSTMTAEIRRAVQRVDPTLPIFDVITMKDIIGESVGLERVGSFVTTFFALAALLMATLGVYGMVSYSVRQRRVEIGTRMALGAVSRDVLTLIVGGGLKTAAYGMAIGGVAVAAGVWLLMRVFAVGDVGWLPFAFSTGVVAAVAAVASSFPAWRAARLSPMVAIRDETPSVWPSARRSLRRAMTGISRAVSDRDDSPAEADASLLTEFAAASRAANSFAEAIRVALATLCERLGAQSAVLLEKGAAGEYHGTVAIPEGAEANCSLPADGFLLTRLKSHASPLPVSAGDLETLQRWAEEHRSERLGEIRTLADAGTRLAVSLRARREILGVVLLGAPRGRDTYSAGERQLLRMCADQLALMIENARLTKRVVEQETLRRDLALAAEVQKRLLPERPPEITLATLAAMSLPARTVGGDYYDFIDVGDSRIGIALADVAGKGVAAALIMSVVQASLRIISAEGEISLPRLAAKMNRFLHRSTSSNSYATFFYAQLDERNRRLSYVNAGHNPPFLLRFPDESSRTDGSDPVIEELTTGGTVIGLFPEMDYEEATIDLRPGDVLVAFTDGVTEALNVNEEEFGEGRLKDLLRRIVRLPVDEMSSRMAEELRNWITDTSQYDDLTFVVMKVN